MQDILKNLQKHLLKIVIFLAVIFGAIFASVYFAFQIKTVSVDRTEKTVNIRVGSILQILEYVKNANLLILKTDSLERHFLKIFKELKSISIEKEYPKTLKVIITQEKILAKWVYKYESTVNRNKIGGKIIEEIKVKSGYLNKNNIFLEHNTTGLEDEKLLTIVDIQPRKSEINFYDEIPDGDYLEVMTSAKALLEEVIGRNIVAIHYYRDAQEIYLIDNKSVEYWIYLGKDVTLQVKKLEQALRIKNILKWKLRYVDLRISDKIIYTFD
jgi:hypothetical protein